jgi:subtilisin family serine protease
MINPLDVVNLTNLMAGGQCGNSAIRIGLIDGPVAQNHPDLTPEGIYELPGRLGSSCSHAASFACQHGTFVAGILKAKRSSAAPAICPDCTLLLRPVFAETTSGPEQMPNTTGEELASAIMECIMAGANILNISAALLQFSDRGDHPLQEALDYSARRDVLVVAAAGNQGRVGSSLITRHPWVIPVAACDLQGRLLRFSNLGSSVGRRGLSAPAEKITSLGSNGQMLTSGGTSAAAPFVTGAIALLWSLFPGAAATQVKTALTHPQGPRQPGVIPPLLDAWASYQFLAAA